MASAGVWGSMGEGRSRQGEGIPGEGRWMRQWAGQWRERERHWRVPFNPYIVRLPWNKPHGGQFRGYICSLTFCGGTTHVIPNIQSRAITAKTFTLFYQRHIYKVAGVILQEPFLMQNRLSGYPDLWISTTIATLNHGIPAWGFIRNLTFNPRKTVLFQKKLNQSKTIFCSYILHMNTKISVERVSFFMHFSIIRYILANLLTLETCREGEFEKYKWAGLFEVKDGKRILPQKYMVSTFSNHSLCELTVNSYRLVLGFAAAIQQF